MATEGSPAKLDNTAVFPAIQRGKLHRHRGENKKKQNKKIHNYQLLIPFMGRWCSGNTTVFGTVVGSSILSRPELKKNLDHKTTHDTPICPFCSSAARRTIYASDIDTHNILDR